MRRLIGLTPVLTTLSLALLGPAWSARAGEELRHVAERALEDLKSSDSALTNFFEHSAGYAVFPGVRSSGLPEDCVRGVVYETLPEISSAWWGGNRAEPIPSRSSSGENRGNRAKALFPLFYAAQLVAAPSLESTPARRGGKPSNIQSAIYRAGEISTRREWMKAHS